MPIFKKMYMHFYSIWNLVIDAKYNPLRFIPSLVTQFYVTMVLAIGWAVAFGVALGYYSGIFTNIFAHVGIVFMFFSQRQPSKVPNETAKCGGWN